MPEIPSEISPDKVIAAERDHLSRSRAALRAMREHAESLDSRAAGDWVSEQILASLLEQRIAALADLPDVPLFFGRLDRPHGDPHTLHIGRRHVHDDTARPLVIDWRAPVARAFYQASPAEPMGVGRRRRFGFDGGELTAFEDEDLTPSQNAAPTHTPQTAPTHTPQTSRILREEIERPRTGPMRDIVATIQPDQDEIVREELARTVCVQGAPGTGKTAVGLHRAAYLLFTHRERLVRSGVLIVGPNRAFLSYISAVLPALGEIQVEQATVSELLGEPTAVEDDSVAALKGDARMAEVLRKALWRHLAKPEHGLVYTKGASRYRVPDHEIRETIASLRGTTRYGPGRAALAQRLAHAVLVRMEQRGEAPDDRVQDAVARSRPVKEIVERVWPKLTPETVLFRLFSEPGFLERAARGILSGDEASLLTWRRPARSAKSAKWTAADRALLDELADLIERTPSLGHVVIDEAQDLSAMQLRALGRRCGTGSATVLGDLAQGTTPWSARSWGTVLQHLGQDGAVTELTLGFRVPREILDFAARLLPAVAPSLAPPRSLRSGSGSLVVRRARDVIAEAASVVGRPREGSTAVIVADDRASEFGAELDLPVLSPAGDLEHRLVVVPASLAKGLEYDHVVVVEPAAIAASEDRGLARLYVVLTRAVTSLVVLHSKELPPALAA